MTELRFTVQGLAEPKGSTRVLPAGHSMRLLKSGRPLIVRSFKDLASAVITTSDNPDVKAWQSAVSKAAWCARQELPAVERPVFVGPIELEIWFFLRRPIGLAKSYVGGHLKKPDLDKLLRAVKDALTTSVWEDDSQVTDVIGHKRYAALGEEPRATIVVRTVDPPLFQERGVADGQ